MLNFEPKPTTSTAPLTVELGTAIYNLIKQEGTALKAIQASIYDPENILRIEKEVERIVKLIDKKEVVTPAELDEQGNVVTEEVKDYVELTSDIIDVDVVLADFPRTVEE